MAAKKLQMKLNNDLKRAVHSGDGYEDFMTVLQFEKIKLKALKDSLRKTKHRMDDFYLDGGEILQMDDGAFHATLDGVEMHITFDEDEDVTGYSITGIKKKTGVADRILGLFIDNKWMDFLESAIANTEEELKDLDNDNTLRGLGELRDLIRKDTYLTASAISGLDLMTEECGNNLFNLLEDDE